MNSQGHVDLNSNMAAHPTGMMLLLSVTLINYLWDKVTLV